MISVLSWMPGDVVLAMSSGVVWGLVLLGGAGLLLFALWLLKRGREVMTWSVGQGRVKRAWLKQSSGGNGVTSLSVIISYEYEVAGRGYAGKGPLPGLGAGRSMTELPSAGDVVVVFYDPVRPGRSVLHRGENLEGLFVLLTALAAMALAVGMLLLGEG